MSKPTTQISTDITAHAGKQLDAYAKDWSRRAAAAHILEAYLGTEGACTVTTCRGGKIETRVEIAAT
jgi:hypothetical protein